MVLKAFSISSHSCSDCSAVSFLPLRMIGASRSSSADVEELQPELLRVGEPGRVIRADQLAAPFDVLARHEIRERDDPAADAVARFDDGDFVSGARQLVGGGQAAEARADDHHAAGAGAERRGEALGDQQRRTGGERALQHLAAGESAGLAVPGVQDACRCLTCQIPSSKSRIPTHSQIPTSQSNSQVPTPNSQRRLVADNLGVGSWECLGIWSLEAWELIRLHSTVNHCTSTRRFRSELGPAGSSQPRPTMSMRLGSMV